TNHHILMDGWSNSQLLGEVLQRYRGETPPRSGGRYRDYIAWLNAQDTTEATARWTRYLGTVSGPLMLADGAVAAHDNVPEKSQ
ncbi:condensation domain-containing protein, partial [Acinetobacter variabilis]|uniref:condensation domain-containing protein n=1 Tax=Acinetobacter variabilis TaxID=70346 RepID=UPI0030FCFEC6